MLQLLAGAVLLSGVQAVSLHGSADTEAATKALAITYVDCARNRGVNLSLRITARDLRTSRVAYTNETLASIADVKNEVVYLRADAYEIMATSGDCSQSAVVQVSNDRMPIILIGAPGVRMFGARTSIAGSLPVDGAIVYLVYKNLSCHRDCSPDGFVQIPAVVNKRTYYAGEIPVGEATVRLYDATRSRWLDSQAIRIGTGAHDRNVIYNIGACTIQRNCSP